MSRLGFVRRLTPVPILALLACAPEEVRDPVVARLDGEAIHRSELEARAAQRLYRAELGIHILLTNETERLIEERLLERAARARGLDPERLLQEIENAAKPVSDADVDAYLAEHPGDAPTSTARPRIQHYLEETRRLERRHAFLAELRDAAQIEILIDPPLKPRGVLDLRDAPSRGAADAEVTVVHFADLKTADGAQVARDLAALAEELSGRVRVVYRHHPAERDELGLRTAQLAAAAERRDSFWSLHDRLAAAGGIRQGAELEAMAHAVGMGEVYATLDGDRESLRRVQQDLARARQVDVRRAPTLFVNGRYLMGLYGKQALRDLIFEELAAAR